MKRFNLIIRRSYAIMIATLSMLGLITILAAIALTIFDVNLTFLKYFLFVISAISLFNTFNLIREVLSQEVTKCPICESKYSKELKCCPVCGTTSVDNREILDPEKEEIDENMKILKNITEENEDFKEDAVNEDNFLNEKDIKSAINNNSKNKNYDEFF